MISYTPIRIPTTSSSDTSGAPSYITLPRRDLFDVRFQLLNDEVDDKYQSEEKEGEIDEREELAFVDAPSDLVPGVYEGGLKTWECSIDLVSYLSDPKARNGSVRGKKIIEVS